jgi:hypothetical protein
MKASLLIAVAASLVLCGCSVFRRSATWDSVVSSRSHYSESGSAKDNYVNHLHQVLQGLGVEHKVVTYQFSYHNAYHEEAVGTVTAVIYRDETTGANPWWIMDEYHHVPVWLPNWSVDAQLQFFIRRPAEVISIKEYAGSAAPQSRVTRRGPAAERSVAHSSKPRKFRTTFVGSEAKARPQRTAAASVDGDPLTAPILSGSSTAVDSRADAAFRAKHGTDFDPTSSIDRAKMNALRRQLLNRSQSPRLGLR